MRSYVISIKISQLFALAQALASTAVKGVSNSYCDMIMTVYISSIQNTTNFLNITTIKIPYILHLHKTSTESRTIMLFLFLLYNTYIYTHTYIIYIERERELI